VTGSEEPFSGFYHAEYKTDNRPLVLKRALDRAVDKGWLNQVPASPRPCLTLSSRQISGKGFSGTYRLMHPYYPGPRELWGKDFHEPKEASSPRKAAESPK
jgi:hypothetical protein